MDISVVGLGKLGSPLVAVLTDSGHNVVGLDVNKKYVDALNRGQAPVQEPDLQELITKNKDRITATTSYEEAINASDVTFIVVPTPSDENGRFVNVHVATAAESIGAAIEEKGKEHLVVVVSTVMPGDTEHAIHSALHNVRKKYRDGKFSTSNEDAYTDLIKLCYSPEFIALGSVVSDMQNPDMILIGEDSPESGKLLEEIQMSVVKNEPRVVHVSIREAEIAKIAINTYITMKISYANLVGEICRQSPDVDGRRVLDAVGSDSRIGHKYLKIGTPYGGPCFPRDTIAFGIAAAEVKVDALIPEAIKAINDRQSLQIAKIASFYATHRKPIAVLGLSYKPGTNITEEAAGVAIANALVEAGKDVVVYDPLVTKAHNLSPHVRWAPDLESAVEQASVVVLALGYEEFVDLPPHFFDYNENDPNSKFYIDCWNILSDYHNVVRLGVSHRGW